MSRKKIPNCPGCTNYDCKKIRTEGGYKYWGCLIHHINGWNLKNRISALEKQLINAAKEFLPDYDIYNSGGVFICEAPYGTYVWHFAVRMKQNQIWNYREFQEGYKFGLNPEEPYRDANPYKELERKSSWDCGYILGIHKNGG